MEQGGKLNSGPVTVLGAGSWGTTLAGLLADKGLDVTLWAREDEVCSSINSQHENTVFLPGVALPESLKASGSLKEALFGASLVVSVVPTQYLRAVLEEAREFVSPEVLVVSATKGIEISSLRTPSGIISEVLGPGGFGELAVLSGPSFAKEVAKKLPAAVTVASVSAEAAGKTQEIFSTSYFRVYTNTDVIGVEIGGALKNVVAIASGISDGLALGLNARAALITRGLAEITRLGVSLGSNPETFYGLSGLGDLVLTCTGALSRNYTVGVEIGKGEGLDEITGKMRMVAEGVKTAEAARELGHKNGVDMPITEAVCDIIHGKKSPKEAVGELMTRKLKGE